MRGLLFTNQKKEGDFLIKAFFNSNLKRPSCIDVIREVPFTFNDTQVRETAILRFKDNHKLGEVYTSEIIFGHIHFEKCYYLSGYTTFPVDKWDPFPQSKYRMHPTLQTIWKSPLESKEVKKFMTLFNNFHLFIKKNYIVEPEYSSLQNFAQYMYEAYKKENENKKVCILPKIPQTNHIESLDMLNKVFSR